ncbi:S1 family peptidase [Roseibium sp. M-1]
MPNSNLHFSLLRRWLCCALFCLVGFVPAANAADSLELNAPFDADMLTVSERTFLQAGLVLFADYDGKLDGVWSKESHEAFDRYFGNFNMAGPILNWVAIYLAFDTDTEFRSRRWATHHLDLFKISVLIPFANLDFSKSKNSFTDKDSSLVYAISKGSKQEMKRHHSKDAKNNTGIERLREEDLWITQASFRERLVYLHSHRMDDGRWSSIGIYAAPEDALAFALVTASITRGYREPVAMSDRLNKAVDRMVLKLDRISRAQETAETDTQNATAMPASENTRSIASGFAVSTQGGVLTSMHALEGCSDVSVAGHRATIAATDPDFDLLLLTVPGIAVDTAASFASATAALNSDITLGGFPLSGLLGGFNVTRGAVTSLKGLAGTGVTVQISAPVQPGMEGGPVVNNNGEIVGVIAEKLDAKRISEIAGDLPQNVNFAVSGEIAQLFLFQNGVTPVRAKDTPLMDPERMADFINGFAFPIACMRDGN